MAREIFDDEIPVAEPPPDAKALDDPYGLSGKWSPNRVALDIIKRYLVEEPERGELPIEVHAEARAAGIMNALRANGRDVTFALGRAHWLWDDVVGVHIPCCSVVLDDGTWCGNGPLPDSRVPDGDCGEHR